MTCGLLGVRTGEAGSRLLGVLALRRDLTYFRGILVLACCIEKMKERWEGHI